MRNQNSIENDIEKLDQRSVITSYTSTYTVYE